MNEKNEQKNYMKFTCYEGMNESLMLCVEIHGPFGVGFEACHQLSSSNLIATPPCLRLIW